jgi:outer membrane protein OmpA-like peptidoglycan-associated protein
MLRLILLGLFLIPASVSIAQSTSTIKKNADRAFSYENWGLALDLYEQYQQAKPGDPTVLGHIGICHYQLHHGDKAKEFLQYVTTKMSDKADADAYYFYARTLHGQMAFAEAIEVYKQFLRKADSRHPLRARVRDAIVRCLNAQTMEVNESVALVENLGKAINSEGDEFAPLPSRNHPNRIYYAAARPGCKGGKRNDEGLEDEEKGKWCSDMFFAERKTAGWENGGGLSPLINSPRYEVAADFGANGNVLYFFRGFSLFSGDLLADTAQTKDEYALYPPAFDGPMETDQGDRDLFFFNDSTILFASRREGGYGSQDLYFSKLSGGLWTQPQNLGPTINSAYDEFSPFLAKDGRTLYFSSNRTESMGGSDVFYAVFNDEKASWEAPKSMGAPINSPGNEAHFRLSGEGGQAYFSSDRLDSYGQRDIYIAYFKTPVEAALHASKPVFFDAVAPPEVVQQDLALPALYYTNDQDVLSPENLQALLVVARAAVQFPESKVFVHAHTASSGQSKFDLYYGIKRAELVANKLKEMGIAPERILLKSAGAGFPASRTVIGATPYPAGEQLNNRIELSLSGETNTRMQRRAVPEAAEAKGAAQFDSWMQGLCFKVEMVAASQIVTTDALALYSDLLIDSKGNDALYHYSTGFLKYFGKAQQLQQEVLKSGFPEARIVAFVDGIKISKAEAVSQLKKYPELASFIQN